MAKITPKLYRRVALGVLLLLSIAFGSMLLPARAAFAGAGVASANPLATEVGIGILKLGGNAFDAAIAVTAALAVVEPAGSGLGGGGFWLLHDAASGKDMMLDGREKAPLAASRDMYLDSDGKVIGKLSIDGALAAGIPGEPAALVWLAENFASLPLPVLLQPAIRLAEEGFPVGPHYRRLAGFRLDALNASPAAAGIFLVDGEVPAENTLLVQRDLANTLRTLASAGHDGFYRGEVAQKLVDGVRNAGGIWTLEDLSAYRVKLREPVVAHYKGMKITSATLPSSGGLVLAQALNILAGLDLEALAECRPIPVPIPRPIPAPILSIWRSKRCAARTATGPSTWAIPILSRCLSPCSWPGIMPTGNGNPSALTAPPPATCSRQPARSRPKAPTPPTFP